MFVKITRTAAIVFLITMLTGCATALVVGDNKRSSSSHKIETYYMSDEVVAIARPKDTAQNSTKNNLNGLVMIGLNNSYHITHGYNFIEKLTELDATAISINENQEIAFDINGTRFSGLVSIDYTKNNYTYQELKLLNELGFSSNVKKVGDKFYDVYTVKISLAGNVYSKYQGAEVSTLTKGRKVKFSTVSYKKDFNPMLFVELPFAIAFDVATAPVQAMLLVAILAGTQSSAR